MSASNGRQPSGDSSSSTDEEAGAAGSLQGRWFGLRGPSLALDPRVHAFRRDIADVALAGQVISSHYARAMHRACGPRTAFLWPAMAAEGNAVSELLPGEGFAVLEYTGPWAWGYCLADHRVGFVEAIALVEPVAPTHVVCEAKVPVFADGSIGAAQLACMPMGARLIGHEEGACLLSEIGCVPMSHVRREGEHEDDPAAVAMRLKGAPFVPGGRSHAGVDAAGLVQLALAQCGVAAPRDLDMQAETLGGALPDNCALRRGDLVFAGEEGGIMIDDLMLLHASRTAGKVTVEPAAVVEGRAGSSLRRRIDL